MNKDVMNQGVQILLDRMDTNPEEFEDYSGKWGDIIGAVHARKSIPDGHSKDSPLPFLTDPEVNALYDKLEDVRRENFTADVLRRLADDSVKQQELWANVSTYSTSNSPYVNASLTTTLPQPIGHLTEREKRYVIDNVEAYKKAKVQEIKKNKAIPR
jgi:hypothetical protein